MRNPIALLSIVVTAASAQAQDIPSPEEHFGHRVGADRKLVSWAGIVDYLTLVGERSERVNVRDIGPTTAGRPFLLLEIASARTMANLDDYKAIQQRLYFQDHTPGQDPETVHSDAQRAEILERGRAVVLITCTIHATEVGAAQMSLELVHELATSNDARTRHILDNVIFLLVPSLNPDGQAIVADWYNKWVGSEHEAGPTPWLYHPYVGHDNNRDMYMYTQAETRHIGQVLYEEWFPSIWLDEHQMGSSGPRIFTMPATDPINMNVHPLIYRLNGFYGQAQAADLEAAGKTGIIYDYIYTNYWEGAMAWTGWWHNQVGLLTEVASARLATPVEQRTAELGREATGARMSFREARRRMLERPNDPLPAPRDAQPRTTYPRPWLGGTWTLRDIVDYELIATYALLETAASTRGRLHRQLYEVNRTTIAQFLGGQKRRPRTGYGELPTAITSERTTGRVMAGFSGPPETPFAFVVPMEQHDPPTVRKMITLLQRAGVHVERATEPFVAGDTTYEAGTFVVRLAQVFGRYAKDILESQTYPEVRPAPTLPPQPPYDVTAWSLGLQMGVASVTVDAPFDAELELVERGLHDGGRVTGRGATYLVDARYNDGFTLMNRLNEGARVRRASAAFTVDGRRFGAGSWVVQDVDEEPFVALARELGVDVPRVGREPSVDLVPVSMPRIALYQPWGSNMDEGWTRWVLDHYGFDYTTLHPQDLRAAGSRRSDALEKHAISFDVRADWPPHVSDHTPPEVVARPLAERFDVLVFTHQSAESIVDGDDYAIIPETYRGGIGDDGVRAVRDFLDAGGTVVALGDATGLFIDRWPIGVKNVVGGLPSDDFLIPGSILKIQTDTSHPLGWGMPRDAHGYFIRSPSFALTDGFGSQSVRVAVRYPNQALSASGWTRGEQHIAGRAAGLSVEFDTGGQLVLLGLRPQHRAQTHATFKLLFNALWLPPVFP